MIIGIIYTLTLKCNKISGGKEKMLSYIACALDSEYILHAYLIQSIVSFWKLNVCTVKNMETQTLVCIL